MIKLFIVEDDPVFVKLVVHVLEEMKFSKYEVFENGEECLARLQVKPALILLDFSLGGLNGLDVLSRIKEDSPKTDVVILTGLEDKQVKQKCLDAGASDYVNKDPDGLEYLKKNILPAYRKKGLLSFLR